MVEVDNLVMVPLLEGSKAPCREKQPHQGKEPDMEELWMIGAVNNQPMAPSFEGSLRREVEDLVMNQGGGGEPGLVPGVGLHQVVDTPKPGWEPDHVRHHW